MANKFCLKCGVELPLEATFCMTCGQRQPELKTESVVPRCSSCGAELLAEARFCASCGASCETKHTTSVQEKAFCISCGNKLTEGAAFCASCGVSCKSQKKQEKPVAKQTSFWNENPVAEPQQPKRAKRMIKFDKSKFMSYSTAIVSMVLSVVMVIMVFLPIVAYDASAFLKHEEGDDCPDGIEVGLSPIQNIILFFCSMSNADADELADEFSEMGEDIEDEFDYEEWEDAKDYKDLPLRERRMFRKTVFAALCLLYSYEDISTLTPAAVASAVFSLFYIIMAIVLLIVNFLYLLSVLGIYKKNPEKLKSRTFKLFFLLPMLAIATYTAIYNGNHVPTFLTQAHFSGALVTTLVMAGLALAGLLVIAILQKKIRFGTVMIARTASTVLAIGLLIALFAPVVSAKVSKCETDYEYDWETDDYTVTYDWKKVKTKVTLDAAAMGAFWASDLQKETYDESFEHITQEDLENEYRWAFDFDYYSSRDIKQGLAKNELVQAIYISGVMYDFHHISWWYSFVPLLATLIVSTVCLLLWQNILYFAGERASSKLLFTGKIVSIVLCVAFLALLIVFLIMINNYVGLELSRDIYFKIGIGAGAVISMVFAALNLCVPSWVAQKDHENIENSIE